MTETITMKPIPYRHMASTILNWVYEKYPQLKDKVTDLEFDQKGPIVTHKKE